jgi:hypothetical protein
MFLLWTLDYSFTSFEWALIASLRINVVTAKNPVADLIHESI